MRECRMLGIAFLILGLFAVALMATEFQADVLIKEGRAETTGRLFVKGPKYRLQLGSGPGAVVVLVDRQTERTAIIIDSERIYMTVANASAESRMNNPFESARYLRGRAVAKTAGEETVNGVPCQKSILTLEGRDVMTIWESPKHDFPMRVRTAGPEELFIELMGVREGPVDDDLFTIPEGYSLFEKPRPEPRPPSPRPAITSSETAVMPIGRRIAPGGELRVKVDPSAGLKLTVISEVEDESLCRATPMRGGQAAASTPLVLRVTGRGMRTSRTIGTDVRADEVVLRAEKGPLVALVERHSPMHERPKKEAMFLMGEGRGLLVSAGQPLWLKIESANQDKDASEVKIVFYKGTYADSLAAEDLRLPNGRSKEWTFTATDGVQSIQIEVGLDGGIKLWMEQSVKK